MRAQATPGPLSLPFNPLIPSSNSAKILEVVGKNSRPSLDTLAQLAKVEAKTRKSLQKRAFSKYVTNGLCMKLADLESPLHKSYWNAYHCCETLVQSGQKLTGKYCNNRWCLTCNRIRTAKLINGYAFTLSQLEDKRFVTLTVPNVTDKTLIETIEKMQLTLKGIQKTFEKRKTLIVGLRKLEVTFNPLRKDYHPHFHIVMANGNGNSETLIDEWLLRFEGTNRKGQNVKQADNGSSIELFKYFTKIVTKNKIYVKALDTIFRSMYRKRTFQPMGLKKDVSEDVDEIQSIIYNDLIPAETTWNWIEEATDWIDQGTGETLTGYSPSETAKKLLTDTC